MTDRAGGVDLEALAARAAEAIRGADALVVTAGAGMGVDSGLPDFRGDAGFWKAYPMYERLGLSFVDAANPEHFERDPAFGWGFYGHRLALYRRTVPHEGFAILRRWIAARPRGGFVVTSNVDGQFQKAGFDPGRVHEIHGSIHHLQCLGSCGGGIWDAEEGADVDEATMRARRIPRCRSCGGVARPNVLMFGDLGWIPDRSAAQRARFARFLDEVGEGSVAVVELGAGTAIASIRMLSESLGARGAAVVRINPREAQIREPHLGIPAGALEGLRAIDAALGG
jgi:NAD-dependent SIR2 family protein deacetylase